MYLWHPQVLAASPLLELNTYAVGASQAGAGAGSAPPPRVPVRVMGVDALTVGRINPALVARACGTELPVCTAVATLLAGRTTLAQAIADILSRPRRNE